MISNSKETRYQLAIPSFARWNFKIFLLSETAEFDPPHITTEARTRRTMYLDDIKRQKAELTFSGTPEDFLSLLRLTLELQTMEDADQDRAAELIGRTSQLSTLGKVSPLSFIQRSSPSEHMYKVKFSDKYGTYGVVGVFKINIRRDLRLIEFDNVLSHFLTRLSQICSCRNL